MRPLYGDDSWNSRQRPRAGLGILHDRNAHNTTSLPVSNNHMSFFVANEASLDSYIEQSNLPPAHIRDSKRTGLSRKDDKDNSRDDAPSCSWSPRASVFSQSPMSLLSQTQPAMSRPMTPIMLGSSCVGSTSSSCSSRRASLTSSLSDRAGYDVECADESTAHMSESGSVPQLVMPNIKMPSRRPFTETGKSLGRLKILLAGDAGVGKTSLLKAIVQSCQHIVHVDPISPLSDSSRFSSQSSVTAAFPRGETPSTATISEVHASTKPYPEWWQDLDAPRAPHKRKIRGDSVLERNICFVDTPGYGREASIMETIMSCVDYVEFQLNKMSSDDLSDSDLMNMLGGNGGCQVDVALYLISHSLKPADLEYIRRLARLTNVIPILARVELLSEEQIAVCKQEISRQLESAGIRAFTFTPAATQCRREQPTPSIPYTASSAMASDHDVMDASLLMSSDYIQPLISSDLAFVVDKIFSSDGASWLRHSAAKKYLQWRKVTPRRPRELYKPLAFPVSGHPSASAPSSVALTRFGALQKSSDATQVQLADWATELQQSLARERLKCETVAHGERAVWLTERLHECMQDGIMVATGTSQTSSGGQRRPRRQAGASKTRPHQDPLGLLQVIADLKAKGWIALEVLGSLGVVSLAVWFSRHALLT